MSWEGWFVAILSTLAILAPIPFLGITGSGKFLVWTFFVVLCLIVVCTLKGTSAGGASEREKFLREQVEKSRPRAESGH